MIPAGWVAAPLQVGGYGVREGLIYRIISAPDDKMAMWGVMVFEDTTGNFPIGDAFDNGATELFYLNPPDLVGIAPAT